MSLSENRCGSRTDPAADDRWGEDLHLVWEVHTSGWSLIAGSPPKWRHGKLYWLTDKGLISSADKGATWTLVARIDKAAYGAISGKDESHLFVLTRNGIVESKDGGKTWADPIHGPDGLIGHGELTWLEYDPVRDLLYLTRMGRDLCRLERG